MHIHAAPLYCVAQQENELLRTAIEEAAAAIADLEGGLEAAGEQLQRP